MTQGRQPPAALRHRSSTADRIETWLRDKVAEVLGKTPADIDLDRPLTELGLDSVGHACIAGELEGLLHTQLDVDVLHCFPSISALAHHLSTLTTKEPHS